MMTSYLIITGASKGIGQTTAAKFLSENWRVINIARTASELPGIINIVQDLEDPRWVEQGGEIIKHLQESRKICLVHNAATCTPDSAQTLTAEKMRRVFELNVLVPVALNQLCLPLMMPGSSIIYMGSTLSEKAVPGLASYITSKHAVAGLMKATCQDLAGTEIHTTCLCPGITDTPMLEQRFASDPTLRPLLENKQTLGRLVNPQEIADVVWFCANHPVMNGAVVHANLGQRES